MKVLFTGGTGLVGKNVLPYLCEKHDVIAPTRSELNLLDEVAVAEYVKKGNFDVIIHSANPNPAKNSLDDQRKMLEDSLRCFLNFYQVRKFCKKLYFVGSGAEMDKTRDMSIINETDFGRSIPKDIYGFAKYIMNSLAKDSENVYNLRLFACYGPGDHESKFITHVIRSILQEKEITIRQNCVFDYLHVYDLVNIFDFFIKNEPQYHDYNLCSGERYQLTEIAEKVKNVMGSSLPVILLNKGFNKEYTADNSRLLNEMGAYEFITLEEGIKIQLQCEKEWWKNEKKNS